MLEPGILVKSTFRNVRDTKTLGIAEYEEKIMVDLKLDKDVVYGGNFLLSIPNAKRMVKSMTQMINQIEGMK
jgi:hypothetical protein